MDSNSQKIEIHVVPCMFSIRKLIDSIHEKVSVEEVKISQIPFKQEMQEKSSIFY